MAAELNVKLSTAESIMRRLPKVQVGRRVFVTDQAVAEWLKNEERAA